MDSYSDDLPPRPKRKRRQHRGARSQLLHSRRRCGAGARKRHNARRRLRGSRSRMAVTQEGSEDREYCLQLFYSGRRSSCEIHFVVTWNVEAHLTVVKEEYDKKGAVLVLHQPVDFRESDEITLDIPMEGIVIKGWKITPLQRPVVTKKQVDNFEAGKLIPCCQLLAETISGEESIPTLNHSVSLKGPTIPNDVIEIVLPFKGSVSSPKRTPTSPPPDVSGSQALARPTSSHLPALVEQLSQHAAKWRDIGANLGFTPDGLDNIQDSPMPMSQAPVSYLETMLSKWLEWAPGDVVDFATLEGLRDALRQVNLGATAHDLHL